MRPFEIALIVFTLLLLLRPRAGRGSRRLLALLALAAAGAHIVLEGARWQLAPAYLLVVVSAGWALLNGGTGRSGWGGRLLRAVAVLLLLVSAALALIFPIPRLPALTGPYPVGTQALFLVDTARTDPYAPTPNAPRELMVQLWYPAEPGTTAPPAPYLDQPAVAAEALGRILGLPPVMLSHVNLITLPSRLGVAPDAAGGPYPLILFSHGWTGFRMQSSVLTEELASHGYVVAAIDHSYAAGFTAFPDGRIGVHNPQALEGDGSDIPTARNALVRQWAADAAFVLTALAQSDDPVMGVADFGRIGVMGHSTGGGSTVEFCGSDDRCRAVLGLDTWAVPVSDAVIDGALPQPVLLLFSESWPKPENIARVQALFDRAAGPKALATIRGTGHYDFSNIPLFSPLAAQIGLKGPLPADRVITIINTLAVSFFDAALKGADDGVWRGDGTPAPELRYDFIQSN